MLPDSRACACDSARGTTDLVYPMKRVIQAILIVAFILAFGFFIYFFARMRQENLQASLPVAGRMVDLGTSAGSGSQGKASASAKNRAKISPEWDETFLDTLDMNLDEDEDLEQVIVVKHSLAESAKISILIADFQPATGSYFRLWKGETLAAKPNAFVVQPRDLLGDGSVELLCFGIDDSNYQTLTVFRRAPRGSAAYVSIFAATGLTIAVEDQPDDTSRKSAAISVFEPAAGGDSPLDQKKAIYAWNPARNAYRQESETFVPGAKIEQLFINKIATGRAGDFESYLDGLWIKEAAAQNPSVLLYFDAKRRQITIHSNQEKQEWDWSDSNAAFAGIYASISNSAVPEMLRLLNVELVGVDRVKVGAIAQQIVKFAMREDWNGVYRRFAGSNSLSPASALEPAPIDKAFDVSIAGSELRRSLLLQDFEGYYRTEEGLSIELKAGNFLMEEGGKTRRGNFSFFQFGGQTILDLGLIDEKNIPSGRLSYIVSVRTAKDNGIGTMVLKPARILSDRAQSLYRPDIVLSRFKD